MQEQNQGTLPDIRHTRLFNAPIQKVWDAVSTSESIAAWFMPNDFQPILGHEFKIDAPGYGTSYCKVTELDPPKRLVFTWGEDWVVSFELEEQDDKTQFTLIHSGWKVKSVVGAGQDVRDTMEQGWGSFVLPRLQGYVEA